MDCRRGQVRQADTDTGEGMLRRQGDNTRRRDKQRHWMAGRKAGETRQAFESRQAGKQEGEYRQAERSRNAGNLEGTDWNRD